MVSARTSKKPSEAVSGPLRDYELVLILSPELTDETLNSTVEKTSQFITEKGGTVAEVQRWLDTPIGSPFPPLTATMSTPKLDIDGIIMEGVEIQISHDAAVDQH